MKGFSMSCLTSSCILLYICMLLPASANAQSNSQHQKDSLRQAITHAEGEAKLVAYQKLSNLYFYEAIGDMPKLDTLLTIYEQMKDEAERQGDFRYSGFTLLNTLTIYENNRMYDEAIKLAPEHRTYYAKHDLWNYYYSSSRLLAKIYKQQGEYEKALDEAKKTYEEAKERGHNFGVGTSLFSMSNIYGAMSRYKEEEEYMRQSIEILKSENIWTQVISGYFYLCQSLRNQERYDDAKKELVEYEKAIHRAEEFIFRRDKTSWANLWSISGDIYFISRDYDKAEYYCQKLEDENTNNYRDKIAIANIRTGIFEARKDYAKALEQIDRYIELEAGKPASVEPSRIRKAKILANLGRVDEAHNLYMSLLAAKDSTHNAEFNAQLDELRTVYELDKLTAEKEKVRSYLLFAIGTSVLLATALGIWIYYNRLVNKKNRAMAQQIKELLAQQELLEAELLAKTTFEIADNANDDDLCPENRKDKLCLEIRDIMLKEKIYRSHDLTRDMVIERLGTNKDLFIDAFQYCFGMSFNQYINLLRLKDATGMLEQSDMPIEAISERVGFGTVRTFQRQFQTKYNMSPKEYRKALA